MSRARAAWRAAFALLLAAAAARADNGVPVFDHVVIVIEENHGYSQVLGSSSAPYINALAAGGALMTQSFGITHPSQPNYLELFSGSTQGVTDDAVYPHSQFTAPNLGAKLLAAGRSFAGYSETMPSVGFDGASAGSAPATYKRKHNPWVNWQDATLPLPVNKLPPSVNLPYAGFFPGAAAFDTLPTLSFVIPNQLHDMHDGTIAQGDAWLASNLGAYAAWCCAHNSLLVLTFDEDNGSEGNRIVTIFHGAGVVPGQYAQVIDHHDVLATLEDMFGLAHDAGSVTATSITNIWGPPACTPWSVVGTGLAGVAGVPDLAGTGTLLAGSSGSLTLSQAAPSALALLCIALGSTPVPFKCGTLAAFPFVVNLPLVTSGAGQLVLPWAAWPAGLSGLALTWQYAIQDAAAPCGAALSVALRSDVP